MQLVASLLEGLLSTCFTIPTSSTSADTTSGIPGSVPPTPAPDLKRTVSVTSSSGLDQVESEIAPSESVSSTAFSQIQQVRYYLMTIKNCNGAWFLAVESRVLFARQIRPKTFQTDDVALGDPCTVSDMLLLDFEFHAQIITNPRRYTDLCRSTSLQWNLRGRFSDAF